MYRGFPNWRYHGMVERVIVSKDDRNKLVEHGYLREERVNDKIDYCLAPNALLLVNAWNMEKLTKWVIALTIILIVIGIFTIF